uniref:Uncharacterized protein n=1 Tax=Nelumbo nucifera TaxID=4432 RepID=A0A822ZR81_NELNU|nr:TPA_asm: hypothetical protein HUJ06_003676 [Nelumbo nucifera]
MQIWTNDQVCNVWMIIHDFGSQNSAFDSDWTAMKGGIFACLS